MMFADDVAMGAGNEVAYDRISRILEKTMDERGMRVSLQKTQ